jgi:hypothetical protein
MKRWIVLGVVVATVTVVGQKQTLTEQDKADAIRIGTKEKGRLTGVVLNEGMRFGDAMAASLSKTTMSTGFTVRIYSPMTWVEQLASNAAKEYRPFAVADVTDEMMEPVLRVIVTPDKPTTLTGAGMAGASSVEHVVLRDEAKKTTVQPASKEPFTDTASSALRDATYQGLIAKFPLSSVRELRGSKGDGEIVVIVIGTGKEREFTIKRKHFEKLP